MLKTLIVRLGDLHSRHGLNIRCLKGVPFWLSSSSLFSYAGECYVQMKVWMVTLGVRRTSGFSVETGDWVQSGWMLKSRVA